MYTDDEFKIDLDLYKSRKQQLPLFIPDKMEFGGIKAGKEGSESMVELFEFEVNDFTRFNDECL